MVNKEEVRTDLLQAAGEVFAAEGYRNATIRKICQKAGANVAAVNYYFGDKERLYIEAVKHAQQLIEQRWPLPDWSTNSDPEARLRSFLQTFLRRLLSPQASDWRMRLLLREIIEPTQAGEQLVREGFQPFFHLLLDILRPLLPSSVPEPQLKQIGFSIIAQCVFYRAHQRAVVLMVAPADRKTHFAVEPLSDHIYRFSMAAIQAWVRANDERDDERAVDAQVSDGEPSEGKRRPSKSRRARR